MDVFVTFFPHSLVPVVGIAFNPVANAAKGLFAYGLTCLFECHFKDKDITLYFSRSDKLEDQ